MDDLGPPALFKIGARVQAVCPETGLLINKLAKVTSRVYRHIEYHCLLSGCYLRSGMGWIYTLDPDRGCILYPEETLILMRGKLTKWEEESDSAYGIWYRS